MKLLVTSGPGATKAKIAYQTASKDVIHINCALGKNGLCDKNHKKTEGDGRTPIGTFPLRRLWYRPDRITLPKCALAHRPIDQTIGWSDDPQDTAYNKMVALPHPYHHETLWRDDPLYDVFIEIGYNDIDPIPGLGSAIFFHIEKNNYQPTLGCVAIARQDMLSLIPHLTPSSEIEIRLTSE